MSLLLCAVVVALSLSGLLESPELRGYDFLIERAPLPPPHEQIVIVDFDDATVATIPSYPVPREYLARVVNRVAEGEPELIGLDMLLTERRDAEGDEELVNAIARAGNVILVDNFGTEQIPASLSLPEFRKAALDVGFGNLPMDSDGIIRRTFLAVRTREYSGVSFPVALASNFMSQPLQPGRPGTFHLGDTQIPLDGRSPNVTLIGHWASPPAQVVPAHVVMSAGFAPSRFLKKIVLIGQSSAKGKDLFATPLFRFRKPVSPRQMQSGTEIHAAALATLLSGRTVSVLSVRYLWLVNLAVAFLVVLMLLWAKPLVSVPSVLLIAIGIFLMAQSLYARNHVWMPFASTGAVVVLALPASWGLRFLQERRERLSVESERRELMRMFERYVSPEVAQEVWNRRDEIVLSGQERTATVLFSDIRNFTALTASRPSAEVLDWLNRYFTAMSEVIQRNRGFLNKFIGDGMLVVFGVPLSAGAEKDACCAVQASLDMIDRVEELNASRLASQPVLKIGIGIHTGTLTAGNVGAKDRLEYSVIGETVNLASRLEPLSKEFHTAIVLSPATCAHVKDHFATRALGEADVRGFTGKIQVYTAFKSRPADG
jgi:CHASE2 domain-containing sensor protein/class 3 adenylate cyclase